MAINFDEDRSGLLGIDTGVNYDQMAFNPGSLKDSLIKNLYNIEKDTGFSNPQLDKLKQQDMQQFQEKGTPLSLPSDAYTAMAISNFDDIFGNKTFTDALGVNRTIPGFNRPDIDTKPFNINEVASDGIASNLINLPGDFKTSLGQTKDAFLEDIRGLRKGLGSIKDKAVDIFGSGKELALRGIGSIFGGPVGSFIGGALANLRETPEQKTIKGLYDLDSIGRIRSGLMAGYNPVSAFGPTGLSGAMIDRINKINQTLNNPKISKAVKARLDARKKALQEKIEREQAAMRETIERQYRSRPGEYGGPDRQTEREQAGPGYDKVSEAGSF
jgi:hypothetical protein